MQRIKWLEMSFGACRMIRLSPVHTVTENGDSVDRLLGAAGGQTVSSKAKL